MIKMSPDLIFANISAALFVLWVVASISGRFYPYAYGPVSVRAALVVVVMAASIYPFGGLGASGALLTVTPVLSAGLAAFLLIELIKVLGGVELLAGRDRFVFAAWNVVLGGLLYAATLGLLPFDLYGYGYGTAGLFWLLGALTVAAALARGVLKWIFMAYAAAWALGLTGSPNLFDAVLDPFLFFISFGILIRHGAALALTR